VNQKLDESKFFVSLQAQHIHSWRNFHRILYKKCSETMRHEVKQIRDPIRQKWSERIVCLTQHWSMRNCDCWVWKRNTVMYGSCNKNRCRPQGKVDREKKKRTRGAQEETNASVHTIRHERLWPGPKTKTSYCPIGCPPQWGRWWGKWIYPSAAMGVMVGAIST